MKSPLLFSFFVCLIIGSVSNAQQIQQAAHTQKKISFRQAQWQTLHLHDEEVVEQTTDTLKSLGCEVTQSQHDGHVDLQFRCVHWKTITLDTQQQINEWNHWMLETGLETIVRNPPQGAMPTVSYRMTQAQTAHLQDANEVPRIVAIFEMLGCEIQQSQHDDHIDLTIGCPNWITMGVQSEEYAHAWLDWLEGNGFETQHTHFNK